MGLAVLDYVHWQVEESANWHWEGVLRRVCWLVLLGASGMVSAISLGISPAMAAGAEVPPTPTPAQVEFFEKRIRPLLVDHCFDCHSATTKQSGGLRLDDRDALLVGGKDGPVVVPGDPENSMLMQRVLEKDDIKRRMPKGEDDPLSAEEIADLRTWIKQGLFWPVERSDYVPTPSPNRPSLRLAAYPRPATPEQLSYFEKNVRPIFINRCYNCHSDAFKEAGGLRVDFGASFFSGGKDGPVVVPGHPEKSLLNEKVKESDSKKRMPQESPTLPESEIAIFETWIKDGAAGRTKRRRCRPLPPTSQRTMSNCAQTTGRGSLSAISPYRRFQMQIGHPRLSIASCWTSWKKRNSPLFKMPIR